MVTQHLNDQVNEERGEEWCECGRLMMVTLGIATCEECDAHLNVFASDFVNPGLALYKGPGCPTKRCDDTSVEGADGA